MSFRFSTLGLEDEWAEGDQLPERRIHKLGEVRDVSLVTWPTYAGAHARPDDQMGDGGRRARRARRARLLTTEVRR